LLEQSAYSSLQVPAVNLFRIKQKKRTAMSENVAPSPQKPRRGKKRKPQRRRNAAPKAGVVQPIVSESITINQPVDFVDPAVFNVDAMRQDSGVRRHWVGRTAYAALDLGTNNCRLLIAKAGGDGFTIIDAFSRVVRLGEGLNASGKMSDEAMDRAVEALAVCAEKLKRRNVVLARSVATEACRQASNGVQFIERVKRETGIVLDIISPKEEARLAVMGCQTLLPQGQGPAMIFDIGGGSTELVLLNTDSIVPEILDWVSVPWGVVSLTESEQHDADNQEARDEAYIKMRAKVMDSLSDFTARLPADGGDRRLLGTSGTVTTLASVYLKLRSYDRRAVDGLILPSAAMRDISAQLASLPLSGRAEYPTIGEDRADLVVAGCAILETIIDIWPGEMLGVADRGIREGILRGLMESDGKRRQRN
jgi:exopolyphosphatase / guanosine-5'-triphosphate,3'-diphosphate pyrophosphatase